MNDHAPFDFRYRIRWSDVDANRHTRNTAFSEIAIDARLAFLSTHGSGADVFSRQQFGPVLMREDIRYRREVFLDQEIAVRLSAAGLSEDGSHWSVHHRFVRPDGKTAATLVATGGWIDLNERRLMLPPEATLDALRKLEHARDFEVLPSLIRRRGG